MFEPLSDLSRARILISNDDGITAPGIAVLEKIALSLTSDVWVVAPETEQSAVAHSLTIRRPLRVRKVSERHFAVDGTPTDSVLLGVRQVMRDGPPTLVLSGVNRGGNMGDDVTYSGTVAAAMEGTLLGLPSIALSQVINPGRPIQWETVAAHGADVIRKVTSVGWRRNVLININFPDVAPEEVTGIEITRQGKRKIGDEIAERVDPRGDPYVWIGAQRHEEKGTEGTDLEAAYRGAIAVTPLCVDFTDRETMASLGRILPTSPGALWNA